MDLSIVNNGLHGYHMVNTVFFLNFSYFWGPIKHSDPMGLMIDLVDLSRSEPEHYSHHDLKLCFHHYQYVNIALVRTYH
jgi:hypothetical protein